MPVLFKARALHGPHETILSAGGASQGTIRLNNGHSASKLFPTQDTGPVQEEWMLRRAQIQHPYRRSTRLKKVA